MMRIGESYGMQFRNSAKEALRRVAGGRGYQLLYAVVWACRLRQGRAIEPEQALLPRFVRRGDICVDVGAHAGDYTYRLARLVGPTGHVYAFEASPLYASVLPRALSLLHARNVTVIAKAAGATCSRQGFVERDASGAPLTGLSHLAAADEPPTTVVPVITLDAAAQERGFHRRVRFIKIDVEGAELQVLTGAAGILTASRPVVQCEVSGGHSQRYGASEEQVFEFMTELRYTAHELSAGGQLRPLIPGGEHRQNVIFAPEALG